MNKQFVITITAALMCMGSTLAQAGPGANVYACINLPVEPIEPLNIQFTAGGSGDICMNDHGEDAKVKVSKAGLTCTSVGYVEGKASVFSSCSFKSDSIWNLAYSAAGTQYSGSMKSSWWYNWGMGDNKVIIMDPSDDKTICATKAVCEAPVSSDKPLKWEKQGPLYFIFSIGSSSPATGGE